MSTNSTWRPGRGRSYGSGPGGSRSFLASLALSIALVAIAGLIGWLILISIKWLIVTIMVVLGIAMIVVPIAGWRRFLTPTAGSERSRRAAQLVTAVALGIALIVLAFVVARHGWLLIVVPVAVVLIGRLVGRFNEWRARRAGVS
jgi:hypothetical protein